MARIECPRCLRPLSACYCKGLEPEKACIDLLIVQHPSETRHPINSARIASLGISNCNILVGENFTESKALEKQLANRHACLLFPSENAVTVKTYTATHAKPELCVILDGTWRKAKKIYYLNPVLQKLPALTLSEAHTSAYTIRKTPGKGALSTIEATVALLRETSKKPDQHQNCLDAFNRMINAQIIAMGKDTFEKNYASRANSPER
ncbi:tRNA-uridine aminocarboxypropyltransferase [Endozoicomonas lisbonensis]|uniref:tRNA-uridine aminocarboxypropyltransferase n=1 Tax=Endozoicomonas lisbonensis TaxID=3120522 RepID=A0ABV2SHD9_9GAMM